MADNVTTKTGQFVSITGFTDTDWSCTTAAPNGLATSNMRVSRIQFNPSAAGDILVIRNGSVSSAIIERFYANSANVPLIRELNSSEPVKIHIDSSEWTLGTPANVLVQIELA